MKEIQPSELVIMVENRGGGGGARGLQVRRRLERYPSLSGKVLSWVRWRARKLQRYSGLDFFCSIHFSPSLR